jgi:putative endopeptidase
MLKSARSALFAALAFATAPALAIDRLDPRDFDTGVAACTDLYGFANGSWIKANPVPAGSTRINRFTDLLNVTRQQQLRLLQAIQSQQVDPLDVPLAALARSAGDDAALPAAQKAALEALLPAIAELTRGEQVAELLAAYQGRGLPLVVQVGPGSAAGVLRVDAHLLGLPDPAFYTRGDSATQEWLGRYRGYVETLLGLAGSSEVTNDAAWVIDFETKLAAASAAAAPLTLSPRELAKRHPGLDWRALLAAMKLGKAKSVELHGESALAELNRLVAAAHPVQWRAWLRFRIAHLLAPYLDVPFRDAHDRFVRTALRGETPPADAAARALETTRHLLGEALLQRYADTYLPAASREAAGAMVDALRAALGRAIAANTRWQPATREAALAKLEALRVDDGLPATRPHYPGLALAADTLVGNALAIARWRQHNALAPGGRPGGEALQPQLAYLREANTLRLSPALLQIPLFDPAAEPALAFGGLGALIAHELSHGFDLGGASFDAGGAARAWWGEADRAAWITATAPLEAQYSAYAALGERRIDGARTLPENAADLAGLALALDAFRQAQADLAVPKQHALSPGQRFFVAWASLWRENALEPARAQELARAVQSPARFRAIGPLPHLKAFAEAFACKPKDAMLKRPAAVLAWP